jgi:hypothetical protein
MHHRCALTLLSLPHTNKIADNLDATVTVDDVDPDDFDDVMKGFSRLQASS